MKVIQTSMKAVVILGAGLALVRCGGASDQHSLQESSAALTPQACVSKLETSLQSGQAPSSAQIQSLSNCLAKDGVDAGTTVDAIEACVNTFEASIQGEQAPTQDQENALVACVQKAVSSLEDSLDGGSNGQGYGGSWDAGSWGGSWDAGSWGGSWDAGSWGGDWDAGSWGGDWDAGSGWWAARSR